LRSEEEEWGDNDLVSRRGEEHGSDVTKRVDKSRHICSQCGRGFQLPPNLRLDDLSHASRLQRVCNKCSEHTISSPRLLRQNLNGHRWEDADECDAGEGLKNRTEKHSGVVKEHINEQNRNREQMIEEEDNNSEEEQEKSCGDCVEGRSMSLVGGSEEAESEEMEADCEGEQTELETELETEHVNISHLSHLDSSIYKSPALNNLHHPVDDPPTIDVSITAVVTTLKLVASPSAKVDKSSSNASVAFWTIQRGHESCVMKDGAQKRASTEHQTMLNSMGRRGVRVERGRSQRSDSK